MLTRTFVHLPGVGYATEAKWWQAGVVDWADFLASAGYPPHAERTRGSGRVPHPGAGARRLASASRLAAMAGKVAESQRRLQAGDYRYFARELACRDHWRAFPEFAPRTAYLDIETTGGTEGEDITVIGLYDGSTMRTWIKERDLDEFPEAVACYATLVTFFGTGFDVPMLRRRFPDLPFDQLHVDLCFALKRLGYRGGLKKIEGELGLVRSAETRGLSGWDAVRLWREYRFGSREALDLLLRYNEEDVVNLQALMEFAYVGLRRQMGA
jgi:uncharacterized protein YprB with RNaseH-like and TPR domain